MMRRLPILLFCLVLAACAGPRAGAGEHERGRKQALDLHLDLVRGMLAQEQYFAALAHIQEQKNRGTRSLELRFLEAECLRRLGRQEAAEALYRSLLATSWSGRAHHGLGLLYAERNLAQGLHHLRLAVQARPTDVEARNDLGYALLLAGRYAEARIQLATAVELDPADGRGRNNLLLLLLLQEDESGARRLAAQAGLTAEALGELRREARVLRARHKG